MSLSSASVYPEPTRLAFELAASLGYDGVDVMVWNDPVSRAVDALAARLRARLRRGSSPAVEVEAPELG